MKNLRSALSCALLAAAFPGAATAQLALYDAGTAGDPPTAPSPSTQGWTRVDSSGGAITETDVSPDGTTGLNAWNISDGTTSSVSLFYESYLTQQQIDQAIVAGWELRMDMRMTSGQLNCISFEYAEGRIPGDRRYLVYFRLSGADVIAEATLGGGAMTCSGGNDGGYHTYAIRKPMGAGAVEAEFRFDGVPLGPVPGAATSFAAVDGGVRWGANDFFGTGSINCNLVSYWLAPDTGHGYCFGDGSATSCPCGNLGGTGQGCANSSGAGATIAAEGSSSAGADDLVMRGGQLLPGQPALLFVGLNAVNNGNGVVFGDGLRCAGGGVVRLGVRQPDAGGGASWGPGLGAQGGWQAGDTRRLQIWYRDPSGGPCGTGFNLSPGHELVFAP